MSSNSHHRQTKLDHFGRRQPRPARRRTGTRAGVLAAALREG